MEKLTETKSLLKILETHSGNVIPEWMTVDA